MAPTCDSNYGGHFILMHCYQCVVLFTAISYGASLDTTIDTNKLKNIVYRGPDAVCVLGIHWGPEKIATPNEWGATVLSHLPRFRQD